MTSKRHISLTLPLNIKEHFFSGFAIELTLITHGYKNIFPLSPSPPAITTRYKKPEKDGCEMCPAFSEKYYSFPRSENLHNSVLKPATLTQFMHRCKNLQKK